MVPGFFKNKNVIGHGGHRFLIPHDCYLDKFYLFFMRKRIKSFHCNPVNVQLRRGTLDLYLHICNVRQSPFKNHLMITTSGDKRPDLILCTHLMYS